MDGVLRQGNVVFGVKGGWVGQADLGGCELLRVDTHGNSEKGQIGGPKRDVLQSGLGVNGLLGAVKETDGG